MANKLPRLAVFRILDRGVVPYAVQLMTESSLGSNIVCGQGESAFHPLSKIAIELAKTDPTYVHLRFSSTNKYWARRGPSSDDIYIVANSDQPEEDMTKQSCTLFKPVIGDDGLLYFYHGLTGYAVSVSRDNTLDWALFVAINEFPTPYGFSFVDWDALIQLPPRIVFKGDNDKILQAYSSDNNAWYLQFSSEDGNEEHAAQEVQMYGDGHVLIKSTFLDKYWRRSSDNWIVPDFLSGLGDNKSTLFWPVKIDSRTVALQPYGSSDFCQRFSSDGKTDTLSAASHSITIPSRLIVEELVLERNIYNVTYLMENARIYDEKPVVAGIGVAANDSDTAATMSVRVAYERRSSYTFTNGMSIAADVSMTIQAGIPLIAETEIQVSAEIDASYEWADTVEEAVTAEIMYTVDVPPRSRVAVNYVCTSGKCDVPFTYSQRDKNSNNGQFVTSDHTDGIFIGFNYYSFHFDNHEIEPVS